MAARRTVAVKGASAAAEYPNRKTAEAPYINIQIRRGTDGRMIDQAHAKVPYFSRTKLALVAMRLGLEAMTADDAVMKEALERFGT